MGCALTSGIYIMVLQSTGEEDKVMNKEDIIMYVIMGVTLVLAIIIGTAIGVRSKAIFYLLVFIEIGIYALFHKNKEK